MPTNLVVNGVSYPYPIVGDQQWGAPATNWAIAVTNGMLQKAGGAFTLTAEIDFGATYGLKTAYYKSQNAIVSSTGVVRLGITDRISWRNFADSADLALGPDGSNNLTYNGNIISTPSGVVPPTSGGTGLAAYTAGDTIYASATNVLSRLAIGSTGQVLTVVGGFPAWSSIGVAAGGTGISSYTIGDLIYASGATTLSKLGIGTANFVLSSSGSAPQWGLLVNANVSGSAAIAYSKLSLSNSILNADVNSAAAIAYSKLSLSASIVNADISTSAAIALSKLAGLTVQSKTTTYTILITDDLVLTDTSGGGWTGTLPAASGQIKVLRIKKTTSDFSVLTISRAGSDTINDVSSGLTSTTINTQGEEISLINDGVSVWQVVNRRFPTSLGSYTPTITGCGTVSNSTAFLFRQGNCIRIQGSFTTGTVAGALASFSLPSGLALDAAQITITNTSANPGPRLGGFTCNGATNSIGAIVAASTTSTSVAYFGLGTALGTTGLVPANGNATLVNTAVVSYEAIIPISGWKS